MNILLKNMTIITCDNTSMLIKNGNIGIANGIIEFVSTNNDEIQKFEADRIIDGKNRIVMPGLVNSHTHGAMTILRNFADDLALEEWLFKKIFPAEGTLTPEDVYGGTMLAMAEMIKSGTTAFADMYLHMEDVAKAVVEAGIRANLCRTPFKLNSGGKAVLIDDRQGCIEYHRNLHNAANGRIKVYVEIHSTYLFDEQALKDAAELAKQLNTGIHTHLLETTGELEFSINKYGMNSAEIYEKCGVFDVPTLAAHCVHLKDSDIEVLKLKGVNVAHNPTSNLKLGSGIARIPDMLEKGINICLGTDGTASNNNLNMFEEMHIAALLHKGVHMNPVLINAKETIKMATVNGAKAIGFDGETGVIKKGMKADLIILDVDKPHLCPMNDPVSAVVYSAQASDVDTVIIDGNILMENRQLKTIDEELVKYKVKQIAEKRLNRD
ncbi:MAG: amidohydrolase [Clostridia bacterium]|nr:amidohydrolase [Clostridia bacterium]